MAVSPRMLVSVMLLLRATEAETAPPGADPEGSRDFTIFVVMVAICSIAIWEALKWLVSLAKICLLRSCPKKKAGGWGGAAPPICKTSNKMRTCRFLLSFARFCENMSFPAQRC